MHERTAAREAGGALRVCVPGRVSAASGAPCRSLERVGEGGDRGRLVELEQPGEGREENAHKPDPHHDEADDVVLVRRGDLLTQLALAKGLLARLEELAP